MSTRGNRIDEVIYQIASDYGITVEKDDPVMILHTMNERLIQDSKAAQQDLLDHFRSEMEVISAQWAVTANNHSDRTMHTAVASSKAEVARVMEEQSSIIIERWKADLDAGLSEASRTMATSRQTAILNIVASFITLIAAGIVLYALLTM